jgi:acetylornithine deacetylase/succinyl-diaminopimelate desuccinylase family protein
MRAVLTDREQGVLDAIDADEVAALVSALVQAASPNPPGAEEDVAKRLAAACEERGLAVRLDEAALGRPNVHASIGPDNGNGLLLLGHTDTVPPGEGWTRDAYGGEVDGGRVYGRGATDMKGGIAAAVIAMAALARRRIELHGPVMLAAVVDEEESGLGVRTMLERGGVEAAAAIVPEPTEMQTIIACRGNCYVDVEVRGRSAHAGTPHEGRNAIYGATRIIDGVRRLDEQLQSETHPLLGAGSWSVGVIRGGTGTAMVPDRCRISIDRRLLPGQTGEQAHAQIEELLAGLDLPAQDLTATAALLMEIPSFEVPEEHPLVSATREAGIDAGGPDPPIAGWTAACDGGYLMRDTGIPTVVLGPGSVVEQAHRPDESVEIAEVVTAARAYALCAMRMLAPHVSA